MPSLLQRIPAVSTLALVLTTCALLTSHAWSLSPQDHPSPVYPVHGVVLDSLSHQPIPRVLVENNNAATLTDGEGRFELELLEGMLQISARRPGYNSRGQDQNHTVNVGPNTPELTFYLTPEASITGHVTLSTGEPADGITFLAFRKAVVEGRERWEVGNSASTNSEGTFRMANLSTPGLWVLCSVPAQEHLGFRPAGSPTAPASTVGFPSVCYPGPIPDSGIVAPANALVLTPGQGADVEITLARQPFYRVDIAIPNAAGAQGVGIDIHDPNGRALEFSAVWDAKTALATAYVPPGQYYAEAHAQGAAPAYGRVDFRVGSAPVNGLSMRLLPLRPIAVEVRKEFTASNNAQNQFGGSISGLAGGQSAGLSISLLAADSVVSDMAGGGLSRSPSSSDPSLYQIENAIPGRYWVLTYPFEGYVSSITSGGSDLSRQPLIVGPGNSTAPIQVTLRNNTGQIQCAVNAPPAAEPAAGGQFGSAAGSVEGTAAGSGFGAGSAPGEIGSVFLYAIPATQTSSQIPQAQGQGAQPVTIPNIAPGTYRVVAYDQSQEIDLSNPRQLAEIAARGQTVTVSPGATASVQLDVVHATGASPVDIGFSITD